MSENVIQTSFAAGELSPSLFARVDFAKYRSGAATMRNFFVDYRSGASTRTGTEYIRPGALGHAKIRLVRFQQSTEVTYALEFGGNYLRFVTNGASVVEPFVPIAGIVQGASTVINVTNSYANGNLIFLSGVTGMPQINNRYFVVTDRTATTITLLNPITGEAVNSVPYDPYVGAGIVQRVYTINTPYTGDDLRLLKFSQNASVMNITHPNHPPYKLTLISATNWTLVPATFGATVTGPNLTGSGTSVPGPVFYRYGVTAVDDNNQESVPNGGVTIIQTADLRTTAGSNFVNWADSGGQFYNIYGASPSYIAPPATVNGIGFMGTVGPGLGVFIDSNIAPDFSQTPPIHDNPFAGVNPQVSSYFQQRLVFANGGGNLVETFWASKTGAPYNFDISNPPQANDAITAELVSLEVNEIKSMIPMPTGLIMLTTNGAWQVNGGAGGVATQGGPISPITVTATPQAYIGANDVPPIVVNYDILFIQAKGSVVRDLTFNLYQNIYTGNDISITSSHLFYGHQILEWAYAEEPFKSIWCVREDGIMLSLTLVKEQDMYGWARHDTQGNFKSVCTVTEGQTDALYIAVERPIPTGGTAIFIERMADREFTFGAEDSWCVDSGVTNISNFPNATLFFNGTEGTIDIATGPGVFNTTMIGWIIRAGGGIIKIKSVANAGQAIGEVLQEVTNVIPNSPTNKVDPSPPGTWTLDKPFTRVFGFDHIEGQKVSVLADGGVVNGLVVVNGGITLPSPVTKVIGGLAFQAQLQTMPLDLGNEVNTVQGKRKKVGALTVRVKDSRGLKAGMTFETVTPIKELNRVTALNIPVKLITADERIVMDPLWDVPGQICLQIDDPLPATVLGVVPEVVVGDTGGK